MRAPAHRRRAEDGEQGQPDTELRKAAERPRRRSGGMGRSRVAVGEVSAVRIDAEEEHKVVFRQVEKALTSQ